MDGRSNSGVEYEDILNKWRTTKNVYFDNQEMIFKLK